MQRLFSSVAAVLSCLLLVVLAGCGDDEPPPAGGGSVFSAREREEKIKQDELRRALRAARAQAPTKTAAPRPAAASSAPVAAPAASGASRAIFSAADRRSFSALAASLGGRSGVAVRGRSTEQLGAWRGGVAWSTIKVPIAVAALRRDGGALVSARPAITASDNAAAERLWSGLGAGTRAARATEAILREAGDDATTVQSERVRAGFTAFGQTSWALADQARFMAGLRCVDGADRVVALMGSVVAGQRWGLGQVGARFKGGWGPLPAGGYEVRQMGLLPTGGGELAAAIATAPRDGSFATGQRNLTRIARWVKQHVGEARGATC